MPSYMITAGLLILFGILFLAGEASLDSAVESIKIVTQKENGKVDFVSQTVLKAAKDNYLWTIGISLIYAAIALITIIQIIGYLWSALASQGTRVYDAAVPHFSTLLRDGLANIAKAISTELTTLSSKNILSWITRGQGSSTDYEKIAVTALHEYYGDHTKAEQNYVDYILSNFLDKSATVTGISRRDYIGSVMLKSLPYDLKDAFEGKEYVMWDETKTYTLICPKAEGVHPVVFSTSFQVIPPHLKTALSQMTATIKVGEIDIFNFQDLVIDSNIDYLMENKQLKQGALELSYVDGIVKMDYRDDIAITDRETTVRIREKSFLSVDERGYCLSLLQPTFNFTFTMMLDGSLKNMILCDPAVGPARYYADANKNVNIENDGHVLNIRVPRWVLPGIVLSVDWIYRPVE